MNQKPRRIILSPRVISEARDVAGLPEATIVVRTYEGFEETVGARLQDIVLETLEALANKEKVILEPVPEDMSSTEAAKLLRISRSTLLNWVKDGRIDYFQVGTHKRFLKDDVYRLKFSIEPEPYHSLLLKELRKYDPGFFEDQ